MNERLPALTPQKVLHALLRAGFFIHRISGSHYILKHPDKPNIRVTIACHTKDLKRRTLDEIMRQAGMTVEQFQKLLCGHTCLSDNLIKRSSLEILGVACNGYQHLWFIWMFQNMMTAGDAMNEKPCPKQSAKNFLRSKRGEAFIHTGKNATRTFSFTGFNFNFLSRGIGSPSFCMLSR